MRLQQREQVLTNEARTPHTPRVFEVTSLNHNKVQRQGAHVSPEAASVPTKDGHGRPCLPWLWRCCDQAAPHHPAVPLVIYLLHHLLLISILCLPLFPQTPITNNPPSLSAHNLVFSWRIKSPDSFLSHPPQSSSFQPSTHSSPDWGPPLYLPSWCSGGLPPPPPYLCIRAHHDPPPRDSSHQWLFSSIFKFSPLYHCHQHHFILVKTNRKALL